MHLINGVSYWLGATEGVYEAVTDCFVMPDGYSEPAALSTAQYATDPATVPFVADRMAGCEYASYIAAYWAESRRKEVHHDQIALLAARVACTNQDYVEGRTGIRWGR